MPLEPGDLYHAASLAASMVLVMWLPGSLALWLAGNEARGFYRLALATGVSVTLWPLALLWSSLVGVPWSAMLVRAVVAAMLVAMCIIWARAVLRSARAGGLQDVGRWAGKHIDAIALGLVLLVALALRVEHARGLVVPPWVDGLHHTMITQLILDHGSVPDGLRPFLPVDRFFYHFGFHTLSAAVAWVSGISASKATLWTGQSLAALAALTTYALALRLTRRRSSAVLAATVPAALYFFPAYFVSWSRYTQLAGLVALPVVWILVADGTVREHPVRGQALAAACVAGLLLTHYRVFVFFLVGMLVLLVAGLAERRDVVVRGARLATMGVAALALAAPWLAGYLGTGVRSLQALGVHWFGDASGRSGAEAGLATVPRWLFETELNAACIGFAAHGVLAGLALRRRGVLLTAAFIALVLAVVYPTWLGMDVSWALPPFALAISAFLPVALGVGFLSDALLDLAAVRGRESLAGLAVLVAAVVLSLIGARQLRDIVNPDTIIATADDVIAADWIREHTPGDARFLSSTYAWHLGTYRGLDGGYWLPLLARRASTVPPSFYTYGDPDYAREVAESAAIAQRADALSDAELSDLMDRTGATYVYVGPAAEGKDGKLTAARLQRHPELEEVYTSDGVHVFQRIGSGAPGDGSELQDGE